MSFLLTEGDRTKYSLLRGNCALGPSKSIRYSGDFVIVGFISTYFTVILSGFQMLFVIIYNGVFVIAWCHCIHIV